MNSQIENLVSALKMGEMSMKELLTQMEGMSISSRGKMLVTADVSERVTMQESGEELEDDEEIDLECSTTKRSLSSSNIVGSP
jgi:hypothetical protein